MLLFGQSQHGHDAYAKAVTNYEHYFDKFPSDRLVERGLTGVECYETE